MRPQYVICVAGAASRPSKTKAKEVRPRPTVVADRWPGATADKSRREGFPTAKAEIVEEDGERFIAADKVSKEAAVKSVHLNTAGVCFSPNWFIFPSESSLCGSLFVQRFIIILNTYISSLLWGMHLVHIISS